MWKKLLAIICILSLVFVMTACTEQSDIKTEDEAVQAQEDVSEDIAELTEELESLSDDLG